MESVYYFKENQMGRKRSDRCIHYKISAETSEGVSKGRETLACVLSRMNEVSKVERFQKYIFWSVMINM